MPNLWCLLRGHNWGTDKPLGGGLLLSSNDGEIWFTTYLCRRCGVVHLRPWKGNDRAKNAKVIH